MANNSLKEFFQGEEFRLLSIIHKIDKEVGVKNTTMKLSASFVLEINKNKKAIFFLLFTCSFVQLTKKEKKSCYH